MSKFHFSISKYQLFFIIAVVGEETFCGCCCWETVSQSKYLYSIEVLRGFYSASWSVISPAAAHQAIENLYYV